MGLQQWLEEKGMGLYDYLNTPPEEVIGYGIGTPEVNLTPETSPDIPSTAFGRPVSVAPSGSAFNPTTFDPIEWETKSRGLGQTDWEGSVGVMPSSTPSVQAQATKEGEDAATIANAQKAAGLPQEAPSGIPRSLLWKGTSGGNTGSVDRSGLYGSFTTDKELPTSEVKAGGLKAVGSMTIHGEKGDKTKYFYEPETLNKPSKEDSKLSKHIDSAVKQLGYDPRNIDVETDARGLVDKVLSQVQGRYTQNQLDKMRIDLYQKALGDVEKRKREGMAYINQLTTQERNIERQTETERKNVVAEKFKEDKQKKADYVKTVGEYNKEVAALKTRRDRAATSDSPMSVDTYNDELQNIVERHRPLIEAVGGGSLPDAAFGENKRVKDLVDYFKAAKSPSDLEKRIKAALKEEYGYTQEEVNEAKAKMKGTSTVQGSTQAIPGLQGKPAGRYKVNGKEVKWDGSKVIG